MKNLMKNLYEHLRTKKKYNTLELKYDVKCEELEKKQIELNTERRIHQKQKEIWELRLKEQEEQIIKLKEKNKKKKEK